MAGWRPRPHLSPGTEILLHEGFTMSLLSFLPRTAQAAGLCVLAILLLTAAPAPALQPIPAPVPNVENQVNRYALFAERHGANRGRLHAAAIVPNPSDNNLLRVVHAMEQSPNSQVFGEPRVVRDSIPRSDNPRELDMVVDSAGVVHLAWVAGSTQGAFVFYGIVDGAGARSGQITLDTSIQPTGSLKIAAARTSSGSFRPTPVIAYVGRSNFGGTVGNDILLLSRPGGTGNWSGPANVTRSPTTTESNVAFDLVDSLDGALAQGAIVFQRGDDLYAAPTTGSSGNQVNFDTPHQISDNFNGEVPALVVQSLAGSANFYVGHVAYRSASGGSSRIEYLQFSRLQGGGGLTVERLTFSPPGAFPGRPMIAVEPDIDVNSRGNRRVSIAWKDEVNNSTYVVRNNGGISASFNVVGPVPPPPSTFSTVAQLSNTEVRGGGRFGKFFRNGQWRIALPILGGGAMQLALEDVPPPTPTPTVSPTPSPSPTVSPTASPTATPTATPTPTATATPTVSPTATPSPTPTPTGSPPGPTASPTATPSPTPTATAAPTATPTETPIGCEPFRQIIIRRILGRPSNCPPDTQDANGDGALDAADIVAVGL